MKKGFSTYLVSFKNISPLIVFLIGLTNIFAQTPVNFVYTGAAQTWTVPSCVTTITVTVNGAQGGGTNGGLGAVVTATMAVTPGQVLQVNVGGQGAAPAAGWNGGGVGQPSLTFPDYSYGGGGASDIRLTPYALANRVIVAGAGGGMGGGDTDAQAGDGDCVTGGLGVSPFGVGGSGGSQTAGGAGGPPWITSGNAGANGALAVGGAGGSDPCFNVGPGGGGGGGYYGGGGGGSDCFQSPPLGGGGGGGGSSLVPAGGSCAGPSNTGNGQITITYGAGGLTSVMASVNPNCNNGTGSASITTTGGAPAYTYLWSPSGGNSSAATGLSAGNYTVTVTDGGGCTATNTVTITIPTALTVSVVSTTTVNCGANNGAATVNGSGGTGVINYLWNTTPAQTGPTASNLSAGNYTVTLTDANGCTVTQPVTIAGSGSYSVTPSQSNIICFGTTNGSATVTTNGGAAPFTYAWSTNPVQTTPTIANIPAGNYTCVITDASGCTQIQTFTITQPPAVTGSILGSTNVTCFGLTNGSATASGAGGTGIITYSWNTVPAQTNAIANNIAAGTYIVTISDANGCSLTQTVTITQPTLISLTTNSTPSACGINDGTATVSSSGGATPYTYLWLTNPIQGTPTATGLAAGSYGIIVSDASGCTQQQSVVVGGGTMPVADFNFMPEPTVSLLDPLVLFFDGSGGNPTIWNWNFDDPLSGANDSSNAQHPTHVYSDTGTYCITLRISDPTGICRDTIVKCLKVESPFTFYIPNTFTPNNDAWNEMFKGEGTYIREFSLMIFDRWGNKIFESNDITKGWNGKVKAKTGDLVQEDVYVWKVEITDVYDKPHKYIGHVNMVR